MQRMVLRAAVLAAGLVLVVEACSSAATPPPTQPAATASQSPAIAASQPAATSAATPSPVPSASPSAPASSAPTLAGTWNGTWQDVTPDQVSGTFVLTWTQNGSDLTGSIVVKGTPCLSSATVTGTVSGSAISFGAVSGKNTVAYNGTISGSTMKGSYTAPAAFGAAKGTWAAAKQ